MDNLRIIEYKIQNICKDGYCNCRDYESCPLNRDKYTRCEFDELMNEHKRLKAIPKIPIKSFGPSFWLFIRDWIVCAFFTSLEVFFLYWIAFPKEARDIPDFAFFPYFFSAFVSLTLAPLMAASIYCQRNIK